MAGELAVAMARPLTITKARPLAITMTSLLLRTDQAASQMIINTVKPRSIVPGYIVFPHLSVGILGPHEY
jgi:hypothetical protein